MKQDRMNRENTLILENLVPALTRMRDSLVDLSLVLSDIHFHQYTFEKNEQLKLSERENISSDILLPRPKESE